MTCCFDNCDLPGEPWPLDVHPDYRPAVSLCLVHILELAAALETARQEGRVVIYRAQSCGTYLDTLKKPLTLALRPTEDALLVIQKHRPQLGTPGQTQITHWFSNATP